MRTIDREKLASALTEYAESETCLLRPLQKTVFHDIAKDLNAGHTKGHIRFPTGGGKGTMIGGQIEALFQAEKEGKLNLGKKKVLVLTPRTLLVDDLYDRFTGGMFGDIPPDAVGKRHANMTGREKAEALQKPVLVTTYATFSSLVRRGEIKADEYAVAMLDEVHRTRGAVVSQTIKDALPNTVVQGWTATDTYENGNHVGQELFGREKAIHRTGFKEAVDAEILCPVVNYVVRTHIKADVPSRQGEDYRPSELKKVIQHHARDKMAIEMLANHRDEYTGTTFREQNSIFYCVGVKHAEDMAEKLNEKFGEGYAVAVSGETSKDELQKIMRRYADPKDPLKAITNADLLIEGWDAPHASLCFMLRPTKSPILAEQTGGRVMRTDPANPGKVAYVMTFWDDNMPDMITFGDVAGGYHLGVEEERRTTGSSLGGGMRDKPEWMEEDPDLRGMDISFDYWEAAAFVDRVRQKPNGQETDDQTPPTEPGLLPESDWLPLDNLREEWRAMYGEEQMNPTEPVGELVRDIERQAHAMLDGTHQYYGEAELNVDGTHIRLGRFMQKLGDSGNRRVILAIHEDDVEALKEIVSERATENGVTVREQGHRPEQQNGISPEREEWVAWPDLRAELIEAFPSPQSKRMLAPDAQAVLTDVMKKANGKLGPTALGETGVEMGEHTLHIKRMPKEKPATGMILAIKGEDVETLKEVIQKTRQQQRPTWVDRVRATPARQPETPQETPEEEKTHSWTPWPDLRLSLGELYSPTTPKLLPTDVNNALTQVVKLADTALKGKAMGTPAALDIGEHTIHVARLEKAGGGATLAIDEADIRKLKTFIDTQRNPSIWTARSTGGRGESSAHPGL